MLGPVLEVEGDMRAITEQDLIIGQLVLATIMEAQDLMHQSLIILEIIDIMEEEIQGVGEEDSREVAQEEMIMDLEVPKLTEITVGVVHHLVVPTKEVMDSMVLVEAIFNGLLHLDLHMVEADLLAAMVPQDAVHLYLVADRVLVTAECKTHQIGAGVGLALRDLQFSVSHQI